MDSRITIGRVYILIEPQETDYLEILWFYLLSHC